ncbi:Ribosomal protein L32p [Dillenia turbinata]|uniref:Large ribosomal subunit protein bL32m n=1 Tax=Dillenia turbinata TaxID=194707 RepID=A0AAN8VD46_9MAGN
MAFKATNLLKKAATATESGAFIGLRRFTHALALPSPLGSSITPPIQSPPLVLPEDDQNPNFSSDGSLELMAVPKKKVSKHKRGIRNGPKALKPTPVIIRCKLENEQRWRIQESVPLPFNYYDAEINKDD